MYMFSLLQQNRVLQKVNTSLYWAVLRSSPSCGDFNQTLLAC